LYLHSLLSKDALTWTITEIDASGIQYRVRFRNSYASNKFAALANLWTHSQVSGEYNNDLRAVVLGWERDPLEPEETAFMDIDIITNSFSMFTDSV